MKSLLENEWVLPLHCDRTPVGASPRSQFRVTHSFSTTSRKGQKGFTIFELLVTISILALATGVVVSQMGKTFDWELKNVSRKLSSTIGYLYNYSVSENKTLRLVINFEEQSYWVESTPDPFALVPESEASEELKEEKKSSEEKSKEETGDEKKVEEGEEGEEEAAEAVETIQEQKAVFGMTETFLVKKRGLPGGVFFKDVFAEHQVDKLSTGTAYIYFFPRGYVERAVITFRNEEDEKHYSLIINSLSGRVRVEPEYVDYQEAYR